jgi:ABC-2 type transport system permease protein
MTDSIRSEWLKLWTTRTTWSLLGGMLALIGLLSFLALESAPSAAFQAGLGGVPVWLVVLGVLPIFVIVLAIRAYTDEERHGSIVPTLLATPQRRRVLGAKAIVLAVAGVGFGLAASGVGVGLTVAWLGANGLASAVAPGAVVGLVARIGATAALWSVLGVGIGAAVRHQVASIVGALAWVLAVENMLDTALPDVARFLPSHVSNAAAGFSTGSGAVRPVVGAVVLAGWAAASVVIADRLTAHRDVAD